MAGSSRSETGTDTSGTSAPDSPEAESREGALGGLRFRGILLAIGALAFVLRATYIGLAWSHPAVRLPVIDAEAYRARGLEILAGDWLGDAVYYLDPLYPFFLAALYSLIPPDSIGILLAQALLDSVSVVLIGLIGRRVFDDRVGLLAAGLAATYEVFFYYDALLLKAPLMVFLIVAALSLILWAADADRPSRWLPAGLFLGLAALTRGNSLLFAPVLFFWVLLRGRGEPKRRALSAALLTLGVLTAILPVTLRNYVVGDDLVLLNSQAGQNFYLGNFRGNDTGAYRAAPFLRPNPDVEEDDFAKEALRLTGREMKPSEISNFWLRRGLEEIAADPAHFVRHVGKKALLFVNDYEIPDNASYAYFREHVSPMLRLPFPTFGFVFPFAALGMALGWRSRSASILVLFFLAYGSGILLFFNLSRMRLPVIPVILVFAAYGALKLLDLGRARRWPLFGAAVAALALAYPIVHLDLYHQDMGIRYYNMGTAFLKEGARHWQAAKALEQEGRPDAAREEFALAFEQRNHGEAQLELALARNAGDDRSRKALRDSMMLRVLELEDLRMAPETLRAALRLTQRFPGHARGFTKLGLAYERIGRYGLAREAFRRAISIQPRSPEARAGLERIASRAAAKRQGAAVEAPRDGRE